jgi:hypothetical protein
VVVRFIWQGSQSRTDAYGQAVCHVTRYLLAPERHTQSALLRPTPSMNLEQRHSTGRLLHPSASAAQRQVPPGNAVTFDGGSPIGSNNTYANLSVLHHQPLWFNITTTTPWWESS